MNQRQFPRVRRRLKLNLGGMHAFTLDISPQGFATEMMRPRLEGDCDLHGTLELGGAQFPFTAKVCWVKHGEPRLNLRTRFGVRFTGISNEFFRLIAAAYSIGEPVHAASP